MQKNPDYITIFLLIIVVTILFMISFVITISYLYNKKQGIFKSLMTQIKLEHEKTLLSTQLEIQESTFQNISREIHDNISLSLTLAKLNLITLNWDKKDHSMEKIRSSIGLLGESINGLSDISKSLNSDIIIQQGLIKALEYEISRIHQAGLFKIDLVVSEEPIYMTSQQELIIFRIIQEAFNNIIKHAQANHTLLELDYKTDKLHIAITDNGTGFDKEMIAGNRHAGLSNMSTRVKMLDGTMKIESYPGQGTTLSFIIPFE